MKLFNTSLIGVSLILFTVCVSNLFAQENFVNPDGSPAPVYINPLGDKNSIVEEEFKVDNTFNINRDTRVITDEYGSQTVNRACDFGTGSSTKRVQVPGSSVWNQYVEGSCEMWVYPINFSHRNTFISKGGNDPNYTGFHWGYSNSSGMYFRIGSTYFTSSSYTLPLNTWTHIAVTWSGGNFYTVRFYKNGVHLATIGPHIASWNLGMNPLIIGGSNAFQSAYYEGLIDEVRWWNHERSETQIRDNRFVGLGDYEAANTNSALISSTHYYGCLASWTFNLSGSIAYDDIGGNDGTYQGGASVSTRLAGQPIPYNLTLKCDGSGANSYVKIPHSSPVFDQNAAGSIEAWIYLNETGYQPIFQKGATLNTTTFALGISSSDKLFLSIGNHSFISGGTTFNTGKWYHVAATWTGGPNFTVRLYVNGNLESTQTYNIAMPLNTDDAWIGRDYSIDSTARFNGYIDEVRIWNPQLTDAQVRNNMLVSGRVLLPNTELVGYWNFDGNLRNWSAVSGVDGSFNTISGYITNDCRLSGYSNDTSSGAYSYIFNAHTTTINGDYVNQAYFRGKSGLPIPNPGYVQDTIVVTNWSGNVTSVEVFMSIQHEYCNDIDIKLTAPNGISSYISTDNGGASDNGYLTIFQDGYSQLLTSSTYLSPWTNYVRPEVTMGDFGGSHLNGNWILRITDDAAGNSGTLMGWGLRFNNSINISQISLNVPRKYKLYQNYPNPFNPTTNIKFDIHKTSHAKLIIYDILGKEVTTLVKEKLNAGSYEVDWDASNYSSGLYFYRLITDEFVDVKKMLLIK